MQTELKKNNVVTKINSRVYLTNELINNHQSKIAEYQAIRSCSTFLKVRDKVEQPIAIPKIISNSYSELRIENELKLRSDIYNEILLENIELKKANKFMKLCIVSYLVIICMLALDNFIGIKNIPVLNNNIVAAFTNSKTASLPTQQ